MRAGHLSELRRGHRRRTALRGRASFAASARLPKVRRGVRHHPRGLSRSLDSLHITLALYRTVFVRAGSRMRDNWPVAATMFAYVIVLAVTLPIAMGLGLLGGFLVQMVRSACLASLLYLVERIVRVGTVKLEDLPQSFAPYFWDVVGVLFVLWVFETLALPLLLSLPSGIALVACIELASFVFFNAVPELIYLGHHSSLELFNESATFIGENWVEWFPPNLALAVGFALIILAPVPDGAATGFFRSCALSLFVYFALVARGVLFQELHGSSRRSRQFRWKASH